MADYDIVSSTNIECGFFPALWDAINNKPDREYGSGDMCRPYTRLVSNGVFPTTSGTESSDFKVISANNGMHITVRAGEGIFDNKWFKSVADADFVVPANGTIHTRIDSVLIQINNGTREGHVIYRDGTANANPTPPAINSTGSVSEYRIANIVVAPGAAVAHNAMINDRRGIDTPWVTGLITQLGTNELFTQWNKIFEDYFNDMKNRVDDFYSQLTEELTFNFNLQYLTNHYQASGSTSDLNIGIASFNKDTDMLMVKVNNYFLVENLDYTITNNSSIHLGVGVSDGAWIEFVVVKAASTANADSILNELRSCETAIQNATADSGWQTLTLEAGSVVNNEVLKIRKVGHTVNIKGRIKGIISPGTEITTLPSGYFDTTEDTHIIARYSGTTGVAMFMIAGATGKLTFEAANTTPDIEENVSFCSTWLA